MIVSSLLVFLSLSGCVSFGRSNIILYPISREDIQKVPAGTKILIPAGTVMKNAKGEVIARWDMDTTIVVKKDGRFLSNFYINQVMEVSME